MIAAHSPHRPRPDNLNGLRKSSNVAKTVAGLAMGSSLRDVNFQFLQGDQTRRRGLRMMKSAILDGARRYRADAAGPRPAI